MRGWYKAIITVVATSFFILPIPKYAMSSDPHENTSKCRVEYVSPESSKLKLSSEALRALDREDFLVATVKVAKEGYIPTGIEVRTWISPSIFTANIPREMLERLDDDPAVVSIEPAYKLRPY